MSMLGAKEVDCFPQEQTKLDRCQLCNTPRMPDLGLSRFQAALALACKHGSDGMAAFQIPDCTNTCMDALNCCQEGLIRPRPTEDTATHASSVQLSTL